jgi:hypothetical protein
MQAECVPARAMCLAVTGRAAARSASLAVDVPSIERENVVKKSPEWEREKRQAAKQRGKVRMGHARAPRALQSVDPLHHAASVLAGLVQLAACDRAVATMSRGAQ